MSDNEMDIENDFHKRRKSRIQQVIERVIRSFINKIEKTREKEKIECDPKHSCEETIKIRKEPSHEMSKAPISIKIFDACLTQIGNFCENLEDETSGLLLGKISDEEYLITEVSDGGKNEKRSALSVSPDKDYFDQRIEEAERRGLVYLGEWHKHPGALTHPSSGDISTVKNIFEKCHNLKDFLMFIVVKNSQNNFEYFCYYFSNTSIYPESVNYEVVRFREPYIEAIGNIPYLEEIENKMGLLSIEDVLMLKHFPTLTPYKTNHGKKWIGTLLGLKIIVEKTDFDINVVIYEQGSPVKFHKNITPLPYYLIWLIRSYIDKLEQFFSYLKSLINTYDNVVHPSNIINIIRSSKILLKLLLTYLAFLLKVKRSRQISLPLYLIKLEQLLLMKKLSRMSKYSELLKADLDKEETFAKDRKDPVDIVTSQWYNTEKGRRYLLLQKHKLKKMNIVTERYHFSIDKKSKNLSFSFILDKFLDLKLNVKFPANFDFDKNSPVFSISENSKNFKLTNSALDEIHGVYELYELIGIISKLYIKGVEIYER